MEQRQPDDSNEPRNESSADQQPDNQPPVTQPADPQASSDQGSVNEADNVQQPSQPDDQRNQNQRDRENRQPNGRDAETGEGRPPRPEGQPRQAQNDANRRDAPGRGDGPIDAQRQTRNDGPRTDVPKTEGPRQEGRTNGPRNESRPNDRGRSNRPDREGGQGEVAARQNQRDRSAQEREAGTRDTDLRDMENSDGRSDENAGRADRDSSLGPREDRLVIGISLGDYNGIGPEVILKALQYNRLQKICTPVIYGSMRVLNRYRNLLNMKDWNLNGVPAIGQASHKMTNVITCWPDQNQDIQPGQVTPEAGQAALACLQRAVEDLKSGKLDAIVTAPINKYNIQSEEFKFPGHTEYLAQEFGVQDNLMFMVSDTLRVGVVTGHVPLGRVRQNVTRERIAQKLSLMMRSLKQDFGIDKPKIAVLGLNPHAGEEGLLGNEEQEIIKPLLNDLRNKGQLVFGPYPADGFFGTRGYTKFDAVLAMYHDQGLIPFKSIAFEEGVNFTAGMPVVRTSPDHGTAYDIAGKDLADETSMLRAIYTAIDVARQRKEFLELEAGALK